MADEKRYPVGTELRSVKWGICKLLRPSFMRPGTKVYVKESDGVTRRWHLADDFQRAHGVRVDGEPQQEKNHG